MTWVLHEGDCLEIMRHMPDKSVDMILTDIPYGNVSKNGEERAKYSGQLRKLDKGVADIETFSLIDFLSECYRLVSGSIYIFCGIEQVSEIFKYFDAQKGCMTRYCIWRKTNPSPSNGQHMWLSTIENCVFVKKRKSTFNAYCKQAVWDYPVVHQKTHPTQKPVLLFEYLIKASSNKDNIIFDPCAGSGTTGVAADNCGRNSILIEKEPKYCEIIRKRMESLPPRLFTKAVSE